MRTARRSAKSNGLLLVFCLIGGAVAAETNPPVAEYSEVLVYPTAEDGSIMHWLGISPLQYNVAYIGDSMSYDVFKREGLNELTVRPRSGDRVQNRVWRKMHFSGTVVGPSAVDLFNIAGYFDYAITCCFAYIYSPVDRPNAIFSGSSDDALKVIWNGKKIWSNQIQRSPTYDSDQAPAPIRKGWNTLLCVVDQVCGGHLLCARFVDGGKGVTDLEISLDPALPEAKRYPAEPYNKEAAELMRKADALKLDGKLAEAMAAYELVLAKYPLADIAPRAAYERANVLYSASGERSLGQPEQAIKALEDLLQRYGDDLRAEYALLELGRIQETVLKDQAKAEATYRSFEVRYPQSSLAPKALVALARILAQQQKFEDSILTYRRTIKKYPQSDEVMTATVGIADTYALAGEKDKARHQYEAARDMAQDWHDNKYGVDIGKQAWLESILEYIRKQLAQK